MKRRIVGQVVSSRMTKTIRVSVPRRVKDINTGKYLNRETSCFAHDENQEAQVSDTVELVESRPLSSKKRWVLVRIVCRGGNQKA